MPRSSHRPVKISKDKDLKAVVDYFDRPPPPARDLAKEARLKTEKALREREAAEAAAALKKAEADRIARMEAEIEAKRKEEERIAFEADPLNKFKDDDFNNPIKKLSKEAMRDYGYGVPQWSPYRMTKVTSTEVWKNRLWSTTNAEWGAYSKQKNALDPATQSRLARAMVQEMKANASIDHTWEIIGDRPGQDPKGNQFFMP
ncbi:hypothetical protein TrRE_jg5893 [Triparma retinervis]|uniref:Uncharacterized protein n=1 Tax=Triparma retinervis TaxID=2557542 RepID=A0A9W7G0I5_9STRA|nr:hypothetical protein TrRE_jg5893 [Triparma retinervis]